MDKNKSVIYKFSIVPLPIELRGNKLIEVQENFVLEQKQNVCRRLMLYAQRSKIQKYSHQTFLTPLADLFVFPKKYLGYATAH